MSGFNYNPYGNYQNMNMGNNMGMNMGQQQPYQDQLGKYLLEQSMMKQQQNQQPQTNMDFIIVENIASAQNYIVQKGQTLWFRHSSKPEVYVKTVSMIGEPSFGAYCLTPITEEQNQNQSVQQTENQNVDLTNYVPISQFNELQNQVNNMQNMINGYVQMFLSPQQQVVKEEKQQNTTNNSRGRKSTQTDKVGE